MPGNNVNLDSSQVISLVTSQGDITNTTGSITLNGGAQSLSGTGIVLNNGIAQTSGKVVSIQNNGTEVASIDWNGHFSMQEGNSSASPGAATLNTPTGLSAIASSASSVVITNSLVTANSIVLAQIVQAAADATLTNIVRVVPGAGTFTIYGNATATAAVTVGWIVLS
jgi:hypothetical protein